MNKPPILSDEQVIDWIKANYGERAIIAPEVYGKDAQRDADVEWFREDSKQLALECHKSANRRVEQACREVAEKIFTDFYELLEGYHPSYVRSCLFVSKLADLKAKYLE